MAKPLPLSRLRAVSATIAVATVATVAAVATGANRLPDILNAQYT